jgi:hypothetical protein
VAEIDCNQDGEVPFWAVARNFSTVWAVCDKTGMEPQRVTSPSQSKKISLNPSADHIVAIHFSLFSTGKAIQLQAWTSPEGYRRLRLPDLKTIGTRKGVMSALRTARLYPPRKYLLESELPPGLYTVLPEGLCQ